MSTRTVGATCLCGAASHHITLAASDFPLPTSMCMCDSCRHMTGTLFLSIVNLPTSYEPSRGLLNKLTPFKFSPRLIQYHCRTCGSMMLTRCIIQPDTAEEHVQWDAATGTLESFDGVADLPQMLYVADTLDGGFADFLHNMRGQQVERWSRRPGESDQLTLYWRDKEAAQTKHSSSDRLHVHCKCGGVQFWIARPSGQSTKAMGDWPDALVPFNAEARKMGLPQKCWWLRQNGTKFLASACTCNSCRLASGMEVVEWAFVPTVDISLDAAGEVPFTREFGTLQGYRSSVGVRRHFCKKCGAMVFWDGDERPNLLDVAVGLLAAPEGARAETWLDWGTQRVSYREDAITRAKSLVLAIEEGLKDYGERSARG